MPPSCSIIIIILFYIISLGNKKAVFNLKHVNGVADIGGPTIQLGSELRYLPACFICYSKQLAKAGNSVCGIDSKTFLKLAEQSSMKVNYKNDQTDE